MFESVGVVFVEPVGNQFVDRGGLDDSSREDMSAKIACLFQDKHTEVLVSSFVGKLLKTNSSTKTSRTGSYNANINLIGLALDARGVKICVVVSKSRSGAKAARSNWYSSSGPYCCTRPPWDRGSGRDCGGRGG